MKLFDSNALRVIFGSNLTQQLYWKNYLMKIFLIYVIHLLLPV